VKCQFIYELQWMASAQNWQLAANVILKGGMPLAAGLSDQKQTQEH
jgi:hypothetical protein